jgi:hypothetical protein
MRFSPLDVALVENPFHSPFEAQSMRGARKKQEKWWN